MTTEKIDAILASVSQRVEKLVPSGWFYIILHDSRKNELSFHSIRGSRIGRSANSSIWISRPCSMEKMLPDLVISGSKSLLYEREFSFRLAQDGIRYWPEGELPQSWLGVPMVVGEQALGAFVVESWQKTFDANDEKTLETIARQTAIAIQNTRLYAQLERKVEDLRILNHVGQELTRGLVKQEKEILELIYESATKLQLDTRNMYVAFYTPDLDRPDTKDAIYGSLRFPLSLENGQPSSMPNRAARMGMTEYVIRTKTSFKPKDVQKAYRQHASDSEGKKTPIKTRSWLGVPMLSEGQVFGVIVLRNFEFLDVYTEEDQERLGILATQTAIVLQNLRLYQDNQRVQEQQVAVENMAIMSFVAAEFAHKLNNLAGTIPVRIDMAMEQLNPGKPRDAKVIEQLNKIGKETEVLLKAAQEIRQSGEIGLKESVDINLLLQTAIERAVNSQTNKQNTAEIKSEFSENLPAINVERNALLDTLTSIIKNGCESIDEKGVVTIRTQRAKLNGRDAIEISITDTGRGIPASELSRIYDLFYTTKGEGGLGFGLWRDRVFIKRLGGNIDVKSQEGKGSTFRVFIPLDPPVEQ